MQITIINGKLWRGKIHYSEILDTVFISDRVPEHDHSKLIKRVTETSKRTIWR